MLKLLTDKWQGDQLVIFSILWAILFYVTIVIPRGFLSQDIIYYAIFGIPIAIIVVNSFVNEKSLISKKHGGYFFLLVNLWLVVPALIDRFFGTLYSGYYILGLALLTFVYLMNLRQEQSCEIRRSCKYCGKVWHSSTLRESDLVSGIGWDTGIGLANFREGSGAYLQSRRNAQSQREILENLQRCPNCGSTRYIEEIVGND
jgi:hypothetical protein